MIWTLCTSLHCLVIVLRMITWLTRVLFQHCSFWALAFGRNWIVVCWQFTSLALVILKYRVIWRARFTHFSLHVINSPMLTNLTFLTFLIEIIRMNTNYTILAIPNKIPLARTSNPIKFSPSATLQASAFTPIFILSTFYAFIKTQIRILLWTVYAYI